MGFFEDGEYVPKKIDNSILPPFKKPIEPIIEVPKYDYRAQWLWSRYYGPDKGHPANWGYDQWISHLRWMAQNRFNSAMIYAVGYTRIWGDVFNRAFPEIGPYDKEILEDVDDFWGAHYSVRAGWGRSPEETTQLMQKVYAFGREKLGMKFEFNFYLGDFEDTLRKAYPQGKWIDWTNIPHHAYFGAAGRQSILTFTDPKCKEYSQRLWKTFIDTFGTDHRYWISYREESAPNPDNPFDPDKGKSLADAINAQRQWMLEVDPQAEFFHWDWHEMSVWFDKDILKDYKMEQLQDAPIELLERSAQKYIKDISHDITCVSVLPPADYGIDIPTLTHHYDPHPWVVGSLLGYAMQDLGVGGLYVPVDKFFDTWERWVSQDEKYGSRLRGVFHWNEIVQVSPLLDYSVANFAWTGDLPQNFYNSTPKDDILDWYFEHRFGSKDAKVFRKVNAFLYSNFPQYVSPMRIPTRYTKPGISKEEKKQRDAMIEILKEISSLKTSQGLNSTYKAEMIDIGRIALHNISRLDMRQAIGIAADSNGIQSDMENFEKFSSNAKISLTTLADLLATDQRFCVSNTIYRMLNEPGVNKQMRLMMLEHASGRLFDNYPLTDSTEFIRIVSVPLLISYLDTFRLTVKNLAQYLFGVQKQMKFIDGAAVLRKEKTDISDEISRSSTGLDERLLELKNEFMELPAQPFSVVGSTSHPADIIENYLKQRQ